MNKFQYLISLEMATANKSRGERLSPILTTSSERVSRVGAFTSVKRSHCSIDHSDVKKKNTTTQTRCSSEITRPSREPMYSRSAVALVTVRPRAYSELRTSSVDVASSWARLRQRVNQGYPDYWSFRD